ncbi:Microfibril-associated glycoprotein 4 [Lonchura striata]|uniref:Microfibril-associated glycoprotein 4 n=1 Tax=Lonchura striata TaxID=40157 RepID=A0A218UAC6_9PASE|nr:Microfibril-associated glycoprotein 4 [Lonchura striata domestica]
MGKSGGKWENRGKNGKKGDTTPRKPQNLAFSLHLGANFEVFQRRFNGSVSFFRGWNDYRAGFGRADGEYWLGLQSVALLTLQARYELRVELEDFENNSAAATYGSFALSPTAVSAEEDGYALHVAGFVDGGAGETMAAMGTLGAEEDGYALHVAGFVDGGAGETMVAMGTLGSRLTIGRSTMVNRVKVDHWELKGVVPHHQPHPTPAGDSLSYHNGQKFSTFDRDQDLFAQNCAALSSGAWWFRSCHFSNLNGFYLAGPHLSYANGINWAQWKGFYYSLKRSEMKIRRL